MDTRCKAGDIAFVKGHGLNRNKIVTVIQAVTSEVFTTPEGITFKRRYNAPLKANWLVKGRLLLVGSLLTVRYKIILDDYLEPIRPSEEQDEILRLVGLPNKEVQSA